MSAVGSRFARSAIAFRPLPAAQRGLRTSRVARQVDKAPYEAKEPKPRSDQNKYLALGAVAAGAGFFWFYRGGKPTESADASGEAGGMKEPSK
ncbi:hypothetical protein ACJ41O_014651 [Fusarium nematophilum]